MRERENERVERVRNREECGKRMQRSFVIHQTKSRIIPRIQKNIAIRLFCANYNIYIRSI